MAASGGKGGKGAAMLWERGTLLAAGPVVVGVEIVWVRTCHTVRNPWQGVGRPVARAA